jgi:hypothetical protein
VRALFPGKLQPSRIQAGLLVHEKYSVVKMGKKMGRPRVPKSEALGEVFSVRLRLGDSRQVNEAIRSSGLKRPDWLRQGLLIAVRAQASQKP